MGVCATFEKDAAYQRQYWRDRAAGVVRVKAEETQMAILHRWLALPLSERIARKLRLRAQEAIGEKP
jgi:hypothetical protein